MYSSPVRRFTNVLLRLLARLACIRRAASVHSEPGSNSHKGVLRIWTKGHHFNTLTPLLNILYSVVKEQMHSSREPCTILRARKACQGTLLPIYGRVFPRTACPHRTLARGQQAGSTSTIEQAQDTKASDESQVSFACIIKNDVTVQITPVYAAENHPEGSRPGNSRRIYRRLRRSRVDIWAHVCHSPTRHDLLHTQFKVLCS